MGATRRSESTRQRISQSLRPSARVMIAWRQVSHSELGTGSARDPAGGCGNVNRQPAGLGLRERAPGANAQASFSSREVPDQGMSIGDEVHDPRGFERRAFDPRAIKPAVRFSDASITPRSSCWPCSKSSSLPTISTSPESGRRATPWAGVPAGTSMTSGRPPRPIATEPCPPATRRISSGKRRRASPMGRAFMDITLVQVR